MTPILYGQPIFSVQNGRCAVIGHEVLFRLEVGSNKPPLGPADVVGLLDPAQVYPFMDASVMNILMSTSDTHSIGDIFINLAPETITRADLRRSWLRCLAALCHSTKSQITVEFSERAIDAEATREMAIECKKAGARVALDDFTGTSEAARALLQGVRWDFIKICAHAIRDAGLQLESLHNNLRFASPGSNIVFERFELDDIQAINRVFPRSFFQSFCLGKPQPLSTARLRQYALGQSQNFAQAIIG